MGFFATFWHWLNAQLLTYIGTNTARIAEALEPAVLACATLYVVGWGYLQATGRIDEPLGTGLRRILGLAFVLGASLHLWLYQSVIVTTFYDAPTQLAAAVVGSPDPVDTIDRIWADGGRIADLYWQQAHLYALNFAMAAFAVWIVTGLLCVYSMFLIALASVALSVLLALGPLFMAMLLFERTRRLFDSWIGQLTNYALVTVLTVMVGAIFLSLVKTFTDQTAQLTDLHVVDALDMLLLCLLAFLFMRQILPVAAALAGGAALGTQGVLSGVVTRLWAAPIRVVSKMTERANTGKKS